MSQDLSSIVQLLQASIDPRQHKQAETTLREQERQPGFSIALLQITASNSYPINSRLASALFFKNFIKRSWVDEDGKYMLPEDEVVTIKNELVGLMISVPPSIQAQLGEAISVIADSDFWERWATLVDDLISRLTPNNATVNNGVLQVAHSIFRRWRPLFRSDQLFTEINHVLSKFSTPFLTLLQNTDAAIDANQGNKEALQEHISTLSLCFRLFYDLSCQDLPPDFEDNLQGLSDLLNKYINYDNALLHTSDEAEVGPLETVKAEVFEVLTLYVQKYEDAFGPHVNKFMESSWNLLTTLTTDTKYDLLASRALNFLTSITSLRQYAENFNNDDTLSLIIQKVILPNIELRESDVELFEDEPIEFTRRDLEGSDTETRRRAATDFLRQLMQQFQERVTSMTNQYINHYLQQYTQNRSANWKQKDTAIYLFCSIAAVGAVTSAQGVKSTNPQVDVVDFFVKNIAEDLVSDSAHVMLQVDAIKYLYIFRSQMSPQQWQDAFPMLIKHLQSTNYVVHTYCAIAIDRILSLTDANSQPVIPVSAVSSLSQDLLQRLFKLITMETAAEKVQENEFLIRCVMRVLIVLRGDLIPHTDFLLQRLVAIMNVIRHNPSNPHFYYYLFESLGALIHFAAPSQPDKLETALYQPFAGVLSEGIQEFMPYVLQLFAALLEANPSGTLSEYYKSLLPPILLPNLWESRGNTPALVRLLSSLIARGAPDIAAANQLEPILGLFQNLVAKKSSETYAFDLLEAIILAFPMSTLQPYFPQIFSLLFTRLSGSRTEAFSLRFTRLYHFMSTRTEQGLGADVVIAMLDQVQAGIFAQVYPSIILPDTQKLTRPIDRKFAVLSLTKTIADSAVFAEKFEKGWARTCEALLKIMVNPPVLGHTDSVIPDADVDDLSFGVGFTQLNTCKKTQVDTNPEITDLKSWISQYLRHADQVHNGRVSSFLQSRLSPDLQTALVGYMQS